MPTSMDVHACKLPFKDTSGFPKLPPNASRIKRLTRCFRKLLVLNPDCFKCKNFFRNNSSQIAEQKKCAESQYVYIIHPFSKVNALIEMIFFFTWISSIFLIPLNTFAREVTKLHLFEVYVLKTTQRMLIILHFFVGYVDKTTKEIIITPKLVTWHYLSTYFIFDAMATKILQDIFYLTFKHQLVGKYLIFYFNTADILSLVCYCIRINKLLSLLQDIVKYLSLGKRVRIISVHALKTFIILHMFTCFLYGIPAALYGDNWPKESWLYQAGIHKTDVSMTKKYLECLLTTICYFFGASHSMYEVTEPNEQVILSAITLFGRLYTLFLLADLLRNFGIANIAKSMYEQQLSRLEEYMISKNLPHNLRIRLVKFYEYKLQSNYFNEPQILSTLSEQLRTEVFLFSARKLIKEVQVLKCLPKATLANVIASMQMQTFSPKHVILKIGTYVEDIYFIASGTVAIIDIDNNELFHLEDGNEFGIIFLNNEIQQMYQVEAVEPTDVFYINRGVFLHLLDDHPEAIVMFEESVKKRKAKILKAQEIIRRGGHDFLSELRAGKILETQQKRHAVEK